MPSAGHGLNAAPLSFDDASTVAVPDDEPVPPELLPVPQPEEPEAAASQVPLVPEVPWLEPELPVEDPELLPERLESLGGEPESYED